MKFFIFALMLPIFVFAKKAEKARVEHPPHVHGSAKCNIAFDGMDGRIEFRTASEAIIGFEHAAKTEADKKKLAAGLEKLESAMPQMIVFQGHLRCVLTKEKIVVEAMGHHSETVADFKVICEKSPIGSKITFQFQKYFPELKDVDVTVLAGAVQVSLEAEKAGSSLELQ